MNPIDKTATQVLDRLVEMLRAHVRKAMLLEKSVPESVTINNAPEQRIPITIKSLGAVTLGALFSVTHYKTLGDGEPWRDPEMVFLRVLNSYYPVSYQQDSLEIYKESVRFKGGNLVSVIPKLQHWQADFANRWLREIEKEQGAVKKNVDI